MSNTIDYDFWYNKGYDYAEDYTNSDDAWDGFRGGLTGSREQEYLAAKEESEGDINPCAEAFGEGFDAYKAEQPTLAQIIEKIAAAPDTFLGSSEDVYIQGHDIHLNSLAVISAERPGEDWHLWECVQYVAEDVIDEKSTQQIIAESKKRGLREEVAAREVLGEVITAAEAATLYGLAEDSVRKACQRHQLVARKSGGTWLLLREDAESRWGKK